MEGPLSLSFFNKELTIKQKTAIFNEHCKSASFHEIIALFYNYAIKYKEYDDISLMIGLLAKYDLNYSNNLARAFKAHLEDEALTLTMNKMSLN